MIKYALVFAGGVAAGLFIARLYAQNAVGDAIHDGLDKVNLGGGTIEEIAKKVIIPAVT